MDKTPLTDGEAIEFYTREYGTQEWVPAEFARLIESRLQNATKDVKILTERLKISKGYEAVCHYDSPFAPSITQPLKMVGLV